MCASRVCDLAHLTKRLRASSNRTSPGMRLPADRSTTSPGATALMSTAVSQPSRKTAADAETAPRIACASERLRSSSQNRAMMAVSSSACTSQMTESDPCFQVLVIFTDTLSKVSHKLEGCTRHAAIVQRGVQVR
jgi:hypothetical protein